MEGRKRSPCPRVVPEHVKGCPQCRGVLGCKAVVGIFMCNVMQFTLGEGDHSLICSWPRIGHSCSLLQEFSGSAMKAAFPVRTGRRLQFQSHCCGHLCFYWALSAVEYNQDDTKAFLMMFPESISLSVHLQCVCLFSSFLPAFKPFKTEVDK